MQTLHVKQVLTMSDEPIQSSDEEHIRLLEEALADYAARYGLTARARAALVPGRVPRVSCSSDPLGSEHQPIASRTPPAGC